MHKSSVAIIRLILIGSLTVSLAIPFASMNIFPKTNNAVGQEYNSGGYNPYTEYPINDYKYECQTGPFKGFFVESVEFCDAKLFDDKKKKERPIVEEPPTPPQEPPTPPQEPPTPPQEPPTPTPTTASLTVNKEIYGCDIVVPQPPLGITMDCRSLQNNDDRWIQCDEIPPSGRSFCDALPENIFDIRILDDQNIPITEPFQGSPIGTTIENLEPGTYTVEEIKHPTPDNQLGESSGGATICMNVARFTDGGQVNIQNEEQISYSPLCFEYEEGEQRNNCNTITLAAGESRTCTVKNYIYFALDIDPRV
jgi:hypothetical protein